jgi:1-deoxy-D-xylulose-5-phosphate reductoisomerase
MKRIVILGASGTIGQTALSVAQKYNDLITVVGLQAHQNKDALKQAHLIFPQALLALSSAIANPVDPISFIGVDAINSLLDATKPDLVLNGICGAAGLSASIATLNRGITLALANKESMVMAGPYLQTLATQKSTLIIPVDSEHSALFYLLKNRDISEVSRYIITASGGPFRGYNRSQLSKVTPEQAAKHPRWEMGQKISIDSATLANKGLEVIEAWVLFNCLYQKIEVIQHPESVVHALIRTQDGALLAHMGAPNMQLPITNALLYPQLKPSPLAYLELAGQNLSFENIDHANFPMVNLAYQVCAMGYPAPIIYNAVNEVAVEFFIKGKITFPQIADLVTDALAEPQDSINMMNLEAIYQCDQSARIFAHNWLNLQG